MSKSRSGGEAKSQSIGKAIWVYLKEIYPSESRRQGKGLQRAHRSILFYPLNCESVFHHSEFRGANACAKQNNNRLISSKTDEVEGIC